MKDWREELRKKLDLFPVGFPKTDETRRMLELLFTEEDARVASHLSLPPVLMTADKVASRAGLDAGETGERLSRMASSGLVAGMDVMGRERFALMPAVPGFVEMQFMRSGQVSDDRVAEAGRLWHAALDGGYGNEVYGHKTSGVKVVPVRKTVDATQRVYNFEEMSRIVACSGTIALADCACRKTSQNCGGPVETCLMFNTSGEYLISKGLAKKISQYKAMRVLETAADAGLVHITTNTLPPVSVVCACCKCCCASLHGVTMQGRPTEGVRSNFVSTAIPGRCKQCGVCAKACPMEAIQVTKETPLSVTEDKCIGCGVCVHKCRQEALAMMRRGEGRPFANPLAMAGRMMDERGKAARAARTILRDAF